MKKIMIYDAAEASPVGWSWKVGAPVFWALCGFDAIAGVRSWAEGLAWLYTQGQAADVDEIHIWGHGRPGAPLIAGKPIDASVASLVAALGRTLRPSSVVWFRSCATFAGKSGQSFARWVASALGCKVAGHTYNIGFPFHSGLRVVDSRHDPAWPQDEGLSETGEPLWSGPTQPRTILFARNSVPARWV